jgi:hypothetical protein
MSFRRIHPIPRPCVTFYGEELFDPSPKPQAGRPPLICCPLLLIQYIPSFLPCLETVSSIRTPRTHHINIALGAKKDNVQLNKSGVHSQNFSGVTVRRNSLYVHYKSWETPPVSDSSASKSRPSCPNRDSWPIQILQLRGMAEEGRLTSRTLWLREGTLTGNTQHIRFLSRTEGNSCTGRRTLKIRYLFLHVGAYSRGWEHLHLKIDQFSSHRIGLGL